MPLVKKSKSLSGRGGAVNRLNQDYIRLKSDPVPYVSAEPVPSNMLEWHYVVRGPEGTPFEGGFYHGKIIFPTDFPFKPPSISMITPNGRFRTNGNICLSITDFHPDTWNPAWSVSTILTGLLSFMLEKTPTMGSTETSEDAKKRLACESLKKNLNNKMFVELFPEIVTEIEEILKERNAANKKGKTPREETNGCAIEFNQPYLSDITYNVIFIMAIVVFAFTVKYVLSTLNNDDDKINI